MRRRVRGERAALVAAARVRVQEYARRRREESRYVPPAPRYDDVYREGVVWLDSLAAGEDDGARQ